MPSLETLAVFGLAALLFAVVPGPALIYVVTRSVSQGRAAGVVSALGIETGNLVHVAAATLGLSALLASSAVAFAIVKYLGAAYLIYLGVRKIIDRHGVDQHESELGQRRTLRRLYTHGVVVAVLNPKTALFFLAFLPQFVDAQAGSATTQIAVLGVALVAITTVSDTGWALLSATAGAWLHGARRRIRLQRLATGAVYIGLGVSAAVTGQRPATE